MNTKQSRLTQMAAVVFLVASAHADGGGKGSEASSPTQIDIGTEKAAPEPLKQGNSETDPRNEQKQDSDDCD